MRSRAGPSSLKVKWPTLRCSPSASRLCCEPTPFMSSKEEDTAFLLKLLQKLPAQVVRENWPYGVIL